MSHEAGLILLLSSAVLFGVVTMGAASLARARRPAREANAERQGYRFEAAMIVSHAAKTAPTDAHMSLRVGFEVVRLLLRRLLRLH